MGNIFVRKRLVLGVAGLIALLAVVGALYTSNWSSAEEDLGRDPCDSHVHDDTTMNCWVSASYSVPYRYWGGYGATFGSPQTKVRAKNWGVEICLTRYGEFDWSEDEIVDDTTYVRVAGSGGLMDGCLPEATIISASFHYVNGADSHTGSMSFRHPFRVTGE